MSDSSLDTARPAHEGFLVYAQFRYLKVALLLCIACIVGYVWYDPPGGRSGGTWAGYALGTVGALLIVWLAWLGIRKRRYRSNLGSVRGWASAHVYLGLSLIVIGTLHCAFQFGWNVHTVAYVLMCGVILSGIYGIVAYMHYPPLITDNRTQGTRDAWLAELEELNDQSLKLADAIDPEIHRVMVRSVERARIGGGLREQLFGPRDPNRGQVNQLQETLQHKLDNSKAKGKTAGSTKATAADRMMSTEIFMAGQLAGVDRAAQDSERVQRLLDLLARRRDLAGRINRDIRLQARMQIWLYVHVPMTFALLAALIAHIVSVFLYW
jgi:hypothetical protein